MGNKEVDKKTTIELILNSNKFNAFISKNYEFVKKNLDFLHTPRFNIKDAKKIMESITYRKINDWDTKNVLSNSRENEEKGWRKFSAIDLVKLQITSDLRKFGVDIEKIVSIIDKLSNDKMLVSSFRKDDNGKEIEEKFHLLEYYFFNSLNGNKIVILIDSDFKPHIAEETDILSLYSSFESANPCILLPYFSYVKQLFKKDIKINPESSLADFIFNNTLTEEERKVIELLKNNEYREITITKKNGLELMIKATISKRGEIDIEEIVDLIKQKDYQKLTVCKENGNIVYTQQQESIKI